MKSRALFLILGILCFIAIFYVAQKNNYAKEKLAFSVVQDNSRCATVNDVQAYFPSNE